MPRPIIFTEEMKQRAKEDFAEMLDSVKMTEGKFSYNKSYSYENSNAIIWVTAEAYKKILALVMDFTDEVGWHGSVSRLNYCEFVIEDIFVYPQEVTGSTVTTDREKYQKWLYELDDNLFSKIRMQGHSHVNMGVNPSGTDENHREKILGQLEENMFYIFMIFNKSLNVHTIIYDMENNILYEDDDVELRFMGEENTDEFLSDAKEKVQKKTHNNKNKKQEIEAYDIYDLRGERVWEF